MAVEPPEGDTWLSPRERQVLLLQSGVRDPEEIAEEMGIERGTVYRYYQKIREKREKSERTLRIVEMLLDGGD